MVNRVDGVILSVGVVVLVASVIGVVLYDEDTPSEFTVSWDESDTQELEPMSDTGGVEEYSFTTTLNETALANVTFAVEVSFDGVNVNEDTVTVEVESPDGQTKSCEFTLAAQQNSGSGSCEATIEANKHPGGLTVRASNVTIAEENAFTEANLTSGNGDWTTTVTIDGGGGEVQDPTYEVEVTPSFTTWEPSAVQPGASGRAG